MGKNRLIFQWPSLISLILLFICAALDCHAQGRPAAPRSTNYVVKVIEGRVEIARDRSQRFDRAEVNDPLFAGDRVRVAPKSQLIIQRTDQSIYRFDAKTEFQVPDLKPGDAPSAAIRLL